MDRFVDWSLFAHGAALASVGLALEGVFRAVHIAAGPSYANPHPCGSHPLLDPLWSTERVSFIYDGAEAGRGQAAAGLSECPTALGTLRVSPGQDPPREYNCGRCWKCLKLMISLQTLGALSRCSTLPHQIELEHVRAMEPEPPMQVRYYQGSRSRYEHRAVIEACRPSSKAASRKPLRVNHGAFPRSTTCVTDSTRSRPTWRDTRRQLTSGRRGPSGWWPRPAARRGHPGAGGRARAAPGGAGGADGLGRANGGRGRAARRGHPGAGGRARAAPGGAGGADGLGRANGGRGRAARRGHPGAGGRARAAPGGAGGADGLGRGRTVAGPSGAARSSRRWRPSARCSRRRWRSGRPGPSRHWPGRAARRGHPGGSRRPSASATPPSADWRARRRSCRALFQGHGPPASWWLSTLPPNPRLAHGTVPSPASVATARSLDRGDGAEEGSYPPSAS